MSNEEALATFDRNEELRLYRKAAIAAIGNPELMSGVAGPAAAERATRTEISLVDCYRWYRDRLRKGEQA